MTPKLIQQVIFYITIKKPDIPFVGIKRLGVFGISIGPALEGYSMNWGRNINGSMCFYDLAFMRYGGFKFIAVQVCCPGED